MNFGWEAPPPPQKKKRKENIIVLNEKIVEYITKKVPLVRNVINVFNWTLECDFLFFFFKWNDTLKVKLKLPLMS